ncbi:Ctr copper transporter family-domain-containing protein [Mycena albidolilacea]|uniref:Copper transport protein n=1 Tax=Mycena albidolilacea TaxID=1033008 RepID=A0AAD6ZCZ4_9AGAR|nr:Ctr copper transporter family-domain-containing protein [Mycena albidolilacea]
MSNDTETASCKLSMLWNWDTVDACFISEQWHIHNIQEYAGSLLALFLVVILLEGLRKVSRVYDRFILRRYQNRLASARFGKISDSFRNSKSFRPTIFQQFIRSIFYFFQFSTAYLVMLAAMTHNGGVILAVFAGALVGFLFFGRDTVSGATVIESSDYGIYLEQIGASKSQA